MRQHNGFTLVELVITMVIIGLISTVAIPRFFDNQKFTDRGFYTEVINAIRYAQQYAVATNCDVQVTLSANEYRLHRRPNNCTGALNVPVSNPVDPSSDLTGTQANVTITADTTIFSFNALGAVSTGANNNITVGGNEFCVHDITGYISEAACP